ncbi:hypothetical protein AB6A40_011300 [Gnathostoma spinigerum]|uniref:FHF complex subunit HOOK-interacting protein C-terminal domain-containing protein n=1 Tax=Gnathostoma spinigerum TaxID=75299 RepID=A0ABD6EXF1_9BILA
MTTSTDYFQFVYDGTSESETDNTASLRDGTSSSSNQMNNGNLQKRQDSATGAVDTDAEMARSFVLKGWNEVEDMETFMALLERVPTSTRTSHSLEENVALIDSRIQYLNELKAEREENISMEKPPDLGVNEEIKTEKSVVIGIPIQCSEHQGVGPLLESLLRSLDSMIDNSLSVNLHVTSLLALLSSYTHPLIASYFFDSDLEIQPGVKRLFKILTSLKARIDSFSSSVDGFDVLLERGVKFLTQKAEKYEKLQSLERSRFNRLWPTGDGKMGVDNSRDVEQSETLSNLFK